MAEYIPPIENLPTFDTLLFRSANDSISIAEGDTRYLRFPVSQGSETISGNLTITGEGLCSTVPTTNNSLANKLYVDSAVVGGSILGLNNTFTGINTFTNTTIANQIEGATNTDIVVEGKGTGDVILKTGTTNRITCADNGAITIAGSSGQPMSITTTGNMTLDSASNTNINIGNGQTSGVINIGVNSSSNRTGAINLGSGVGAGAVNTALNWGTSSNQGQLSFQGGSFTLTSTGNYTQRSGNSFDTTIDSTKGSGNTYIANGNSQTGNIQIGTGTGIKTMSLGGTSTTLNLVGTAITATLMSITNAVSAASASITGLMSAGSISTAGTLSAGASTLTSVITNELDGTAVGTAVSIYDEGTRNGAITLGTGATGKTITIGESSASTVNLRGSTIDANKLNVSGTLTAGTFAPTSLTTNTIQGTAVGTAVSLYDEASRTGTVSIATGTGTRLMNIGGDSSSTNIFGSTCDFGGGTTTTAVNIANNGFFAGTVNIAAAGTLTKTINIGTTTGTTLNLIGTAINATLMSITNAVSAASASITGLMSAGSISTAGTLSAGASTLTSVITDTQTGSAVGTAVSLYNEATRSGRIELGAGATDTRDIFIGTSAVVSGTETRLRGANVDIRCNDAMNISSGNIMNITAVNPLTIQTGNTQNISIGSNMTNTAAFQLGGTAGGSATYTIASGNSQTGTISIGSGTGTKTMTVGGTGTTLNLKGSSVALGGDVSSGNIDIGGALTTGNLTLGSGAGQVNISTNAINSCTVAICNNTSVNNNSICTIGKNSALRINNDTGDVNLSTAEVNAGGLTICTDATSTRTINIGRGNAISIANSATPTTTLTGSVRINDGGSASSQIGNNSAIPVNIIGDVKINAPSNTQSTSIGNLTGTISMLGDITLTQTTYPSTATTQIGYTITKTFATTVLGDTTGTFTVVGTGQALGTVKGVYLITCGFELTNSGSDTVNNKALCLSLSSGSGTPVNANGAWEYFEEINDSMGSAGTRYIGTLCGVYIKTVATAETLYLNGYANTSGSQTISATGNCSITRIA
jgi:hypothetical protein